MSVHTTRQTLHLPQGRRPRPAEQESSIPNTWSIPPQPDRPLYCRPRSVSTRMAQTIPQRPPRRPPLPDLHSPRISLFNRDPSRRPRRGRLKTRRIWRGVWLQSPRLSKGQENIVTSTLPLAFSLTLPLVVEGTFSVAAIQSNIAYPTTTREGCWGGGEGRPVRCYQVFQE